MKSIKRRLIVTLAIVAICIGAIGLAACEVGDVEGAKHSSKGECQHNYIIDKAVEATCVMSGWTEGEHCALCHEVLVAQERIPALGHIPGEYISNNNATCQTKSTETARCTREGCNGTVTREDEDSQLLEHVMSNEWNYSMEYHWHISICGCDIKENYEKHTLLGEECIVCGVETLMPTEGVEYAVSKDGTYAEVVGYTGTDCRVAINDTYNNLPVTHIGDWAFMGQELTEVIIPSSVTNIGRQAFAYCDYLTEIVIPSRVISIIDNAFGGCDNLTNITVEEGNVNYCSIDGNLYNKAKTKLIQYATGKTDTSFVVPNGVKDIVYPAFSGCKNLREVKLPNGLMCIEGQTFQNCESLLEIVIPKSVTYIGVWVFNGCQNLTNITVEEGNVNYCSIDGNLYNKAKTQLMQYATGKTDTSFVVPNGVTEICSSAVADCFDLREVTLPNTLKKIGNLAFSDCINLRGIIIPDSVTSIGGSAFSDCINLREIIIPDSVTSIGGSAFCGCENLTSVIFENAEGWKVKGGVTIHDGNSVTNIHTDTSLLKEDLLLSSNAANYLIITYYYCEWTRVE